MTTSTADAKKQIVLPGARPGDVFDVRKQSEGRFMLVRLQPPDPPIRKSREEALKAIADAALHPTMSWEELRQLTREP